MSGINMLKSAVRRVGMKRLCAALGLAWLLTTAAVARADDPLSAQFNSRYKVGGQTVNAAIVLNGDGTGSYTLDDGSVGSLTVEFHGGSGSPHGPQSPGYYTGTWQLGNEGGTFRWNLYANGAAFVGSWYHDTGKLGGPWNGQQ